MRIVSSPALVGADSGDRTARTGNPRGDPDEKADENDIRLPGEVAFFIAKRLRSNVRELEGALNRVIANANFTGRAITIDFVREALRDLLALQENWSPSTIFRRRWPSITKSKLRICFLSVDLAR